MTTLPGQLLLTLLLGLVAAALVGVAIYLLLRAARPPRRGVGADSASKHPSAAALSTQKELQRPRRLAAPVALAVLLLASVLAGRFLVRAFYPSGQGAALAEDGRESAVRGASGANLAIARYGGAAAPVLVLTHGWGADRRDWAWMVPLLASRFHVVVWDLPGLGRSSTTTEGAYDLRTLAGDLDSVVASLNERQVILVGHSIGGMINLEYARRHPDRFGRQVVGMVQLNTTFTNPLATKRDPEASRKLQEPLFEPLLHGVSMLSPVVRGLGWLAYSSGLAHVQIASQSFAGAETWDQLDEMARYSYRSSPRVVANGVLGMLRWDASDVLPRIAVPTLVISGNQDVTTLPSASDRMARDMRSAERVSIDRAAHLGPVEQHARYAEAITAFADKISPTVTAHSGASEQTTLANLPDERKSAPGR